MSTTDTGEALRVAYIGNFGVPYSTESHVAISLEAAGCNVMRIPEKDIPDWTKLPEFLQQTGTDFAMWTHTHGYADESKHEECQIYVNEMRELDIPTVGYHLDRWWGLEREAQVYEPFFTQDIVCTADGGRQDDWASIGVNHVWMPPGLVHTELGRGEPQAKYAKEFGFLGSWNGYGHLGVWPWRYEMVLWMNKRYTNSFRAWPRQGQPIRGMEINDLYASVKVMVGDSCLAANATYYWSDRVPETLGRGGLLVHPDVLGLREQFPIRQPLLYQAGDLPSFIAAVENAAELSDDERNEMIDEAIDCVRERHTYLIRMRRVIELVDAYKQGRPIDGTDNRELHRPAAVAVVEPEDGVSSVDPVRVDRLDLGDGRSEDDGDSVAVVGDDRGDDQLRRSDEPYFGGVVPVDGLNIQTIAPGSLIVLRGDFDETFAETLSYQLIDVAGHDQFIIVNVSDQTDLFVEVLGVDVVERIKQRLKENDGSET